MSLARNRINFTSIAALFLMVAVGLSAAEKVFTIGGAQVSLQDLSGDVMPNFAAMRFNRALNIWNVDLSLANGSQNSLQGPFIVVVDSYSGTSGPLHQDGFDESQPPKAFYDFSATVANGTLAAGGKSGVRTIGLGVLGVNAPRLVMKVFGRSAPAPGGFAVTRSLNEVGQPLGNVQVLESGPIGLGSLQTDALDGWVTLGQGSGEHIWKFTADGYLPVWRKGSIGAEAGVIPNPRLVRRGSQSFALTPLDGGATTDNSRSIQLNFGPGVVSENTTATLTPLTGQTLPGVLPLGWSPLQAFTLELSHELSGSAAAILTPWGSIPADEDAILARWDEEKQQWTVLEIVKGNNSQALGFSIPTSGSYALVGGDGGNSAPPPAQTGAKLEGSAVAGVDFSSISASGKVDPPSSPASTKPELVTGVADVVISSDTQILPSGVVLRCEVQESYRLRDQTQRKIPQYESFIIGYQRPGDSDPKTLHARFPLRPTLLFGAEELNEATVHVDVVPPGAFEGTLFDAGGGFATSGGTRILAGAGDMVGRQAVQLRSIAAADFAANLPSELSAVRAFELDIGQLSASRHLVVQFDGLEANSLFVLARVLTARGFFGFEPVERLATDTLGKLSSAEPASGDRLTGIVQGGQYLLLRAGSAQGLITGVIKNAAGEAAAGLPVRVNGLPWLTFSRSGGSYRLIAPAGDVRLSVNDPANSDSGEAQARVTNPAENVVVNFSAVASGPRALSIQPADGTADVPRINAVVVEFDKAINPGTLASDGVQIVDPAGQVVSASVALNLKNTVVTVLPANPLAPSTKYTVRLAATIADPQGRAVIGATASSFTTETDLLDRAVAKLTIYEPVDGVAAVEGSPGTAEGEAPVILVNESTGRTATILSKPDGSFKNSIEADVDDFISAVVVNKNGTQNTVPASKQIFADGSVGLFPQGGILEAQSETGPMQVIIDPGAIPNKTKLKLDSIPLATFLNAAGGTQPDGGALVGSFKLHIEGDALTSPPRVRVSLPAEKLNLDPGEKPEDDAFLLLQPRQVQGQTVYEYVQRGKYENGGVTGELRNAQPSDVTIGQTLAPQSIRRGSLSARGIGDLAIFDGDNWAVMLAKLRGGGAVEVNGKIQSAMMDSTNKPIPGTERPLIGAVAAIANSDAIFESQQVARGNLIALANEQGIYRLIEVLNQLQGATFAVAALSPLFPAQVPSTRVTYAPPVEQQDTQIPTVSAHVYFSRNPATPPTILDTLPPTISAAHTPIFPNTNQTANLRILANDETSISQVTVTVASVQETVFGTHPATGDVSLVAQTTSSLSPQTVRAEYQVSVPSAKPLLARLNITATDNGGHTTTAMYPIEFVNEPPPNILGDTNDTTGPFVVNSSPALGEEDVPVGTPIDLYFSELLDTSFVSNPASAFTLSPAATSMNASYFPDEKRVRITFSPQKAGQNYTLTVTSQLRDFNGNAFDQNPYNNPAVTTQPPVNDSFTLRFKTAPLPQAPIPNITSGGGVLFRDRYLFAMDRQPVGSNEGRLSIYTVDDPAHPTRVSTYALSSYPREFVLIPGYAYKTKANGPVLVSDLIVAAGGLAGGVGQWLDVIDVTTPSTPKPLVHKYITKSPAAVVTRMKWNAPMLGILLSEADVTSIQVVNLQLLIYTAMLSDQDLLLEPANGDPGKDANGDGDFVDNGDVLPRPKGILGQTTVGLVNAGLVATYSMQGEDRNVKTSQRILDFDLAAGGNFVGAIIGRGFDLDDNGVPTTTAHKAGYRTFASGGIAEDEEQGSLEIDADLKRMLLQFEARIVTPGSSFVGNLALITGSESGPKGHIYVVDITTPDTPVLLNTITIANRHGILQSILQRDDGKLILATSSDLLILDPNLLLTTGNNDSTKDDPLVLGEVNGAGMGGREFVAAGSEFYAVAFGGLSRLFGTPPIVNMVLHRPGTMRAPGPIVPDEAETDPLQVIVFQNTDEDGAFPGPIDTPTLDNHRDPRSVFDNDLIEVVLRKLPTRVNGKVPKKVVVNCESPGATSSAVGLVDEIGHPIAFTSTSGATAKLENSSDLPGTLFQRVRNEDVPLFIEGTAPCDGVTVKFQVFDDTNQLLGEDTVKLTVVNVKVTAMWSDQFPGSKSNFLPGNAGAVSTDFILMGDRADGYTYVAGKLEFQPANSPALQKLRGALFLPHDGRVVGTSEVRGDEIYVKALDDRADEALVTSPLIPLLFSSLVNSVSTGGMAIEEFLAVGFDYNGDGVLSEPELHAGYHITSRQGKLNVVPNSGELIVRYLREHFKVVSKQIYDSQNTSAATIVQIVNNALGGNVTLAESVWHTFLGNESDPSDPPNGVMPIAGAFLYYFLHGNLPPDVTGMKPASIGTIDIPDILHVGSSPNATEHDTGKFVNGYYTVDFLHYNLNSSLSVAIADSATIKNKMTQLATRNPSLLYPQAAMTTPANPNFVTTISLPPGITGDFSSDVVDLHYSIGGHNYQAITLTVKAHVTATPFVAGTTDIVVDSVDFDTVASDVYDWKYLVNPFGAMLTAGAGIYGSAGKIFVWDCPIRGSISVNKTLR